MAERTKEELKEFFEDGDTPTEGQFGDLIDSMLNLAETGTQVVQGTISASGINAGAYSLESLDLQTVTTDIQAISLTGSNVFGSQSSAQDQSGELTGVSSHSFFGPIFQSSSGAHSASYFLTPVGLGSTNNPIEGEGLYIESLKTMGNSTSSLTQASASSLLISRSAQGHLAMDANEIHQFGDNLYITAQAPDNRPLFGNIHFRTSVNPTSLPDPSMTISSSGFVGIGKTTPKYNANISKGFETTGSVSFTGKNIYFVIDDYDDGQTSTSQLGASGSRLISRDNHLMIWNGGLTIGQFANNASPQTGSEALTVKGNSILNTVSCSSVTAHGTISGSDELFFSSSEYIAQGTSADDVYKALVYNTSTGKIFHTGSYGGGGGGTVSTADNDWHINASYLTSSVKVGVKRIPSSYDFEVQGTMAATADVIAYMSSDKRLKDNIKPIENPIDKIKQIGGYSFDWNDKQDIYKGSDFGVIAQEIEKVLPSLVQDREDGYKGVKYDKIVSLLIEAIKDQQKQIDELKKLI